MSGVILSTIFDFGLEAKLRLLQEEAAGILKKSKDGNNMEDEEDGTEVPRPEILWLKSGAKDGETGRNSITNFNEDSGQEEADESVDSDSDTITPECEEEEEEEVGYYEEEDECENNGAGIFEWEMTTILEEPEEEEAAEDEERMQFGESGGVGVGAWEKGKPEVKIVVTWPEVKGRETAAEAGGGSSERGIVLVVTAAGTDGGGAASEQAQGETGISTEWEVEESGTPAEEKGIWSSSTSAEDHHDSPSLHFLRQNETAEGPSSSAADSGTKLTFSVVEEAADLEHSTDLVTESEQPQFVEEKGDCLQEEHQSPDILILATNPLEFFAGEEKENNRNSFCSSGVETGMHSTQHQRLLVINNNGTESRLRSVLRKPGNPKGRKGRCVTFNESLNLFYDAECSCWVHEDDYARFRQEEFERREREELYHYEPLPLPVEYDEPPTLSPPEGYKDRFFPQEFHGDPDVTRVSPPSPPTARRKVFLRDPVGLTNGQEEEVEEETNKKKGLRLGGILKGGRLWRSNSSDGKKVISPPEEPDVVKCTESSSIQTTNSYSTSTNTYESDTAQQPAPTKVSIGTAPLRTSEQIRLAVDSTLRSRKNKKPECSTLVEKLRWLTSLEDEDSDSNQSGFATWPSPRDKNGLPIPASSSSPGNSTRKSDAGTSTSEEHFVQSSIRMTSGNEAKIKQISAYTLEDIEDGLKGTELELESFISKDGGRIERIRKRYGEEGDDYGFSRRPSVKGIKPKFCSTNQIFSQFTNRKSMESPAMGMTTNHQNSSGNPSNIGNRESEYENTRLPNSGGNSTGQPPPPQQSIPESHQQFIQDPNTARTSLSYEFQNLPGRQTEESRAHFEMIRQSFETATAGGAPNFITNYNRPHSWSVSTLPHPHHNPNNTLPPIFNHHHHLVNTSVAGGPPPPVYGTVRRVPNVMGKPLFLHYSALSVEAHPSKIPYPPQQPAQVKVPETPSPTQQTPILPIGMRYYGPPIVRYYNQPPPVPPRTISAPQQGPTGGVIVPAPAPIGINDLNMPPSNPANHGHPHVNVMAMAMNEVERPNPEGATAEEHLQHKEAYSMNV